DPAPRLHAAHAVPRILRVRLLALPLVALQEAGDEQLVRQRRQLHAARFAVRHDLHWIVEIDNLGHRPRLRGVIADLVALLGRDRLTAGQAHQRVAIGRRQVDAAYFGRPAEILLDAETRPL